MEARANNVEENTCEEETSAGNITTQELMKYTKVQIEAMKKDLDKKMEENSNKIDENNKEM